MNVELNSINEDQIIIDITIPDPSGQWLFQATKSPASEVIDLPYRGKYAELGQEYGEDLLSPPAEIIDELLNAIPAVREIIGGLS